MNKIKALFSCVIIIGSLVWVFSAKALLDAHYTFSVNGCICHELHAGPAQNSGLLAEVTSEATCLSCHGPLGVATEVTIHNTGSFAADEFGYITCLKCHNPHGNGNPAELTGPLPWPNADGNYNTKMVGMEIEFYDVDDDGHRPRLPRPQIRAESPLPIGLGILKDVIFETSPSDWGRVDERGLCNSCHGATHNIGADCTSCHSHDGGFAGAGCTGCHDGLGAGALAISVDSPHATNTIFTATGDTYLCEDCHTGHGAGTIEIPNNTTVGINYGSNGESGIALGSAVATGATEAEICWNCHITYGVSEWGTNSGGIYDYGSLHDSSADATASPGNHANWTTGYWKSANFSYKNGPLDTRPVDASADPGDNAAGRGSASIHATGGTVGTQSNVLVDVRCAYCHDVHDTFGASGKPYLRGTWNPSLYPEDGAPQSGDTWLSSSPFDDVDLPRALNSQNGLGGYQIDQNNLAVNNSAYGYATDDALCELCHVTDGSSTGFVGTYPLHGNIIPGFSNDAVTAARNVFQRSQRSTTNDRLDPWMAYFGITDYYDSKGWMGGFRENAARSAQIGISPTVDGQAFAYDDFSWGATVDDATIDIDFHSFTCSKCHNPHASRLPRLMISNCLDVQRNTWDDDYKAGATPGNSTWGDWPNLTPSSGNEGNQEIAYANTAQNCHRYFPAQLGTGTGAYEGKGWNNVTPW